MTDAFALMEEAKWEMEGVRMAAQRYREAASVADPTTLPSGQLLLRRIVPPLTCAIKQAQAEGAEAIAAGGNAPKWAWPIQLLTAEKLAVLTVSHSLRTAYHSNAVAPLSLLPKLIVRAIYAEIAYADWLAAQKAGPAPGSRHVLAAFMARYPDVTCRVWTRWERKLKLTRAAEWPQPTEVIVGSLLIHHLVATSGGAFILAFGATAGGKTPRALSLSDEAKRMMEDIEARAELARPLLMPMLIPPIPWRYEAAN